MNTHLLYLTSGFPHSSVGKESACNAGDLGSIPRLGRSPGEGKGYPLQYSGLENSMDCIVHGVAKSRRQLSLFILHCTLPIFLCIYEQLDLCCQFCISAGMFKNKPSPSPQKISQYGLHFCENGVEDLILFFSLSSV